MKKINLLMKACIPIILVSKIKSPKSLQIKLSNQLLHNNFLNSRLKKRKRKSHPLLRKSLILSEVRRRKNHKIKQPVFQPNLEFSHKLMAIIAVPRLNQIHPVLLSNIRYNIMMSNHRFLNCHIRVQSLVYHSHSKEISIWRTLNQLSFLHRPRCLNF